MPVTKNTATVPVLEIASSLIGAHGGEVVALGVVKVPDGRPISYGTMRAYRQRRLIKRLTSSEPAQDITVRSVVKVGRETTPEIIGAAQEQDCDLIVLGWDMVKDRRRPGAWLEQVVAGSQKDAAIVRPGRLRKHHNVLVPMRAGVNATLALDIAGAVCRRFDAKMTVLHIAEESKEAPPAVEEDLLFEGAEHITVTSTDVAATILEKAQEFDFVILGASVVSIDRADLGEIPERVAEGTEATVLIIKSRRPDPVFIFEPYRLEEFQEDETTAENLPGFVDKWFAENTFDSEEFSRVDELVELKRSQGLTISLGLPTLNEEETVGEIIDMMKTELMEEQPLLDEIVLIDSGSTDRTVEIAKAAGIPVHQHPEILTSQGSYHGKGDALWKSLYVLKGDVIAWIDTDIKNIHPQFVYGVIGPILRQPQLQYVKGFYHRPLKVEDGRVLKTGGGRVTELTARPLINLFFPALSGLVQPLSGEYAGRRSLLEQLSFYSGYGVEIGLLIDILHKFGLPAIGQVDLKQRIHRNQSLEGLSKMSFAIIHAVIESLQARHQVRILPTINRQMNLIKRSDESFHLESQEVFDHPRPPMINVPEYRERFQSYDSLVK